MLIFNINRIISQAVCRVQASVSRDIYNLNMQMHDCMQCICIVSSTYAASVPGSARPGPGAGCGHSGLYEANQRPSTSLAPQRPRPGQPGILSVTDLPSSVIKERAETENKSLHCDV